jgi:penicillin-binding protein 1A
LAGLAAAALALWYYGRDLPDYQALAAYEPPIVSRVYAGDGTLIGEFAAERRIFVPYAAIPARVRQAFISAEDQRFFTHPGFDLYGIARALRDGAVHGTRLQGASTITQQVARSFFLTPERSIERKLREAVLAWRIEHAYTKEKILELYLNKIFLGRQSYGVAAAAQAYFGKALGELTLAEAAMLAALPQAPSRFDPARHPGLVKARRSYVIQRMLEDGAVSEAEAETARAAPLGVKPRRPHLEPVAEYFVEEVRRDMLAKYGEEKMKAGGFVVRSTIDLRLQAMADTALRDGLVAYDRRHGWRGPLANIRSGADWTEGWRRKLRAVETPDAIGDWQVAVVLDLEPGGAEIGLRDGGHGRIPLAELTWARRQGEVRVEPGKPQFRTATGPAIRKPGDVLKLGDVIFVERLRADARKKAVAPDVYALRQLPEVTGALVAMDPHTGRVLAMSGGLDFARSQFNNATQAWRQPGSSFKPYVYLAALAAGFTPTSMLLDAPITLTNGRETYSPKNYSGQFYGSVTMRQALELSLNVATLRLAQATGLRKVAALAMKLGVSDKIEPVFAMPLGAFETTPLRHVTAYSMIVNGGKRVEATLVDRIQDRYGRTVYRHDARECDACTQVAFRNQSMPALPDAREQVLDPDNAFQVVSILQGAAQRSPSVQPLGRRFAGKTGSTNESVDAWFVGFSSDLAVAVWVGFDKPRSLGKKETGSIAAAPIFAQFMRAAADVIPPRDFVPPKGLVAVQTAAGTEYYKRGTEPALRLSPDIDTAAGPGTVPRAWTDDQEVIEDDAMPASPDSGAPRSFSYQPPEYAAPRREDTDRDLPPPSLSAQPRYGTPLPPPRMPGAIYR